jgi:hypothetical protein
VEPHNEEPRNVYSSTNSIQLIKPIKILTAGHVPPTVRREVRTGFMWGDLRSEGSHLEDLAVDGSINGSSGNRTGSGVD